MTSISGEGCYGEGAPASGALKEHGPEMSAACFLSRISGWRDRGLYPLAKVAPESGGGRRWPWRCQLPGSVRDRRRDRAAIRPHRRVLALTFGPDFIHWRRSGESWPSV
jgi:hypothetical protein